MDKKGFLFTVTVFLILIYILLSISVWVKSIEASERGFSEFYKESTVELTIEQITPEKMDRIVNVIMSRNLVRLNDYSISNTLLPGPAGDENQHARAAMNELLLSGSASGSHFNGGDAMPAEANSSLGAWVDNLNASLRAIGVYVSEYSVTNFALGQSDIDGVNYSFDLKLGIKDFTNTSAVSRTYRISNTVNVTGLVDPALARESADAAGDNDTIYRQFFFRKDLYPNSSSISVSQVPATIDAGQGWLYGPLAMAGSAADLAPTATAIAPSDRRNYILVGTFDDIQALTPSIYEGFAGYILTSVPSLTLSDCGNESTPDHYNEGDTFNPIEYSGADCNVSIDPGAGAATNKPYLLAPGFNASHAPECPMLDGSNMSRRCVLILSTYLESEVAENPLRKLSSGGSGIYGLETMRDFVMCGYYTHNPKAPSYLQRLYNESYTRNSTAFGIETFVVGIYANDYDVYDVNSRLDRELFYGSVGGVKIRGLPGCRNFNSCSDSPITGIFAVSDETSAEYGLDDIACEGNACGGD
ncbi:hypothetical protein L0Y65_00190 [Candidatus Micrarchaeota archaeon]|nr:hypothetical protein [Candidatus Micrarchaeota archaeon]